MKIKLLLLTFCLCFITIEVVAQAVQVRTERDVQGDILFNAEAQELGSYTLALELSDVKGYKSFSGPNLRFILSSGYEDSFFRLEKEDRGPYSYKYKYRSYLGRYNAKPDVDYPYILPTLLGDGIKVDALVIGKKALSNNPKDNKVGGFTFYYPNGQDTVHAIRSGKVVMIKEGNPEMYIQENKDKKVVYDSKHSHRGLWIEHNDGTIAQYTCLSRGSSLVQMNDRVLVGQPIIAFKSGENQSLLALIVSYLDRDLERVYLSPIFCTSQGLINLNFREKYISTYSPDIIKKELSKKEKKRKSWD